MKLMIIFGVWFLHTNETLKISIMTELSRERKENIINKLTRLMITTKQKCVRLNKL